MATIYLAHLTVYDPALPGTRVLYLSTSGYATGDSNLPPGGVVHTAYDPRIQQPANMRRDIFSRGATGGASEVGYGAMELVNIDGGLDSIADYGLDGQPITLLLGEVKRGGVPEWTTILVGTMEQPEVTWNKVTIRLRDRQAELNRPAAPNLYAGTNALPNGIEGVVGDLKGKNKPRLYGKVFNIAPPMVNTARLVYQANDGAIQSLDAVYDRGVTLTAGAIYVDQAAMEATAPAAGQYRAWLSGGMFRLGSTPAGIVTADATQGASVGLRTVAQICSQIVTGPGGILAEDVTTADLTALDADNSAEVGIWLNAETCRDALDALTNSIGAWWGFDRFGKYRTGRFGAPDGLPVAEIAPDDIISIDRIASNDAGRGVSAWQVTLKYKRIYTMQTTDLAGSVVDARRAELREEYRQAVASDASIKTKHTLAPLLEFETLLVDVISAGAEATRRLDLYKAERTTLEVKMGYDASLVATLDLGDVVQLTVPRFGMDAGKLFTVTGLRSDLQNKLLYLTLWG